MEKPYPIIAQCLSGAQEIADFIEEHPDKIKYLAENEGLPVWRRIPNGAWKAIDVELSEWSLRRKRTC